MKTMKISEHEAKCITRLLNRFEEEMPDSTKEGEEGDKVLARYYANCLSEILKPKDERMEMARKLTKAIAIITALAFVITIVNIIKIFL